MRPAIRLGDLKHMPRCAYCDRILDGGPGGYYDLETGHEVCDGGKSPTTFHEPIMDTDSDDQK